MRIILFANGMLADPAAEAARWVRPGDLVIAADGGTRHVLNAGLIPAHIIGDLDSFPPESRSALETAGTVFHPYPPAKDETDLELALLWAAGLPQEDIEAIVVLGALGGRPDQELANLLLLALPSLRGIPVLLADGDWEISVIRGGETVYIRGKTGDTLSLIPLGGDAQGVTTEGLTYPLRSETLHFGQARGVSNVLEDEEATVHVEEGMVWCLHEKKRDA
ncbi:MAG: thiamine diphosphokinase [Anaerolineae bacterium]|jgi:thiamine pyrophosphokinase|nr:thiamine diphosphokinase [Anaerolineae bacterium]